jgi:hypothetical protein
MRRPKNPPCEPRRIDEGTHYFALHQIVRHRVTTHVFLKAKDVADVFFVEA